MRRGKGKTQRNPIRKMAAERKPETQNPQEEEEEREVDEDEEEGAEEKGRAGKGFYACYLLTSLCPRFRGHTYIGFTVNPRRRIRQHNGEIRSGAWRTKKRRPWEMVFCLNGFPNNVSALQFEWAWQHPTESLAVRQAAATFKSFSGVSNKIKLAYTMLNLPSWSSLGITVNYFSTKYEKHSVGCPALPEHMKVRVCPIEDLPCYTETFDSFSDDGDAKECLGDSEEHEEDSATVNADNLELQGHFVDEPRCYDRMEDCLLDSVNDKNSNVDERYDEHGIEKTFYGKFGWEGECSSTWCSDPVATEMGYVHPPTPEIDREQPFGVINSLARTSSSTVTSETGDGHILTSTDKSILKLGYWSRGEKFKTKEEVVKDQQTCHSSSFQHGIEVIDLLSPSPKSRIRPTTKKRSVSTVCPEIIDLT